MKSTGQKVASSLLAAVLVLTPSVPVFAAGTAGTGQIKGLPINVQVSKGKQVTRVKAKGALPASKMQTVHGTVSPLVTSGKAKRVKETDPNRVMHLGFVLQPRNMAKMTAFATTGKKLSQSQYKSDFAPTSASIALVKNFLTKNKIKINSQTDDMLTVEGTAAQFEKLLKVQFNNYQFNKYNFSGTANDPVLPTEVASVLKGVIGLNETMYSRVPVQKNADFGTSGFFTPDAVRAAYGMMPAYGNNIDGTGRNIAILMTGDYSDADVKKFSQTFGIPYNPSKIVRKHVKDTPYTDQPEIESTLDVEWAHALAPGATITEYETGSLDDYSLYTGLDAIIAASPTVDVINMSFGAPEGVLSPNQLDTWHSKFVEAVAKGITPIAASGDNGAFGPDFMIESVSSPASDPFVLAVGGTSLTVDAKNNRTDETAWGEADLADWIPGYTWGTGGGYSTVFSDFTNGVASKRGVPDVSMLGQNLEMYQDTYGGFIPAGGTSFAAPMWSGIVALAAQKAKHGFGWIRPAINSIANDPKTANVFRDITEGNNGVYSASTGWDAVTGWGSPQNGWSLVQALAAQNMNKSISGTSISGVVVGDMALSYDQSILNGVGTVDILGNGFGDQTEGTVILTDANGVPYPDPVPVLNWTDTDITLNIDEDRRGLFSLPQHPDKAGTYSLKVKTATGVNSNAIPVKFSDFISIDHTGFTSVSGNDNPVYQDVHIHVMTPSGVPDVNVSSTTANFYITPADMFMMENPQGFTVVQNGQTLVQNQDGSYPISIGNGEATIQIASSVAGNYSYYATEPESGMWGGDANQASFVSSATATRLVSNLYGEPALASIGSTTSFELELQDAYGNLVDQQDQLSITIKNTSGDVTGDVTVNDQPVSVGGAPLEMTLTDLNRYLNVSDQKDESFTVVITDTSKTDLNNPDPNFQVEVPVEFTRANSVKITPVESTGDGTPVTVPGQDPNWQTFTVNVENLNQTEIIPFAGKAFLYIAQGYDELYSMHQSPYHVQGFIQNQWQDLQPVADGPYQGDYELDLRSGSMQVRVASPLAGTVMYNAFISLNYNSVNDDYWNSFTAGAPAGIVSFVHLPHMATSPVNAPQYTPVTVGLIDAAENGVASSDTLTLTESAGGPAVKVAVLDNKGKMKVLTTKNGAWSIPLSPTANNQLYIASTAPGVASFTLADATSSNVQTNDFQVTFVNSETKTLSTKPVDPVVPGRTQTVEVDMLDASGQQVINGSDPIALTIGKHAGNVTVTDADGKAITADDAGKYMQNARSGAAIYHVTDDTGETLSYSFADAYVPMIKSASASGQFLTPTKLTLSTISKETLANDKSVPVTLQASDSKGKPLGYAKVYVSMNPTQGGGTASVDKAVALNQTEVDNLPLTQELQAFTTDANGQLQLTYHTPHFLPNGGVDTINAQEALKAPKAKATSTYTYAATTKFVMSPATIGAPGTLVVNTEKPVTMTALDSKSIPMPNTAVYLSLDGTPDGGKAFVVNGEEKLALSSTPAMFYTDGNGQVSLLYTTPDALPSGGTDTIIAQDAADHPKAKGTSAYTYLSTTYYTFVDKLSTVSGTLPASGTKTVTVLAQDKNKKPLGNTTLYLSLSHALNGGGAKVGKTDLTDKPQAFVTDKDTGLVTITYQAPTSLPSGGIDTIVVQNTPDAKPKLKATDSYTFAQVGSFAFDGKTIADNGSLVGGGTAPVTVTVKDAKGQPLANTMVYLSLNKTDNGGSTVVESTEGKPSLTNDPKPFVSDAQGHILLTYQTKEHLPAGGVDTITVQDAPKNPHAKLTDTYTYTPVGKLRTMPGAVIAQPGMLAPNTPTTVHVTVVDAKEKPLANTYVYVSLNGEGTVTTADNDDELQNGDVEAAYTDADGVLDITYTTPVVLPKGKAVTITVQDKASKPSQTVRFTYSYPAVGTISGKTTFGTKGSLQAGTQNTYTVTVQDQFRRPMANAQLRLNFTSSAAGGGSLTANGVSVESTTMHVQTNDQGQIVLSYKTPESLPESLTDTLLIFDEASGKSLKITYSY